MLIFVLLLAAFICFTIVAFAPTLRVNLLGVGLALWVLTQIIPSFPH